MAWGNQAGPGPSYFRTYIEWRVTEYGESSAYVQYKYSIYVDSGDFGGTSVARSWGGNVSLYGNGWYGDSGWRNYGWVGYGKSASASCWAQYSSWSGAFHKSSCGSSFSPSAPTWKPKAASNVSATRNSQTQNTVTWSRNVTAARPYAGQYVDRQVDGGSWELVADVSGGATSYVDKTTRPNHAYRYRVCPHNAAGSASHAYSGTVSNPPTSPAAPTGAVNARVSDARNTVSWNNNVTGEAPYASLKIERSINGGGWSEIASVGGGVSTYADTGCAPNNCYVYRVRAYNQSGYSGYASSGVTYNTPCAPGTPTGARSGDTTVVLSIPNDANTATATEIQRSTDLTTWATVATTSGKATSYTDNPGGGTFYYRARNVRGNLASAWSSPSSAVVTICAPAAPTLTTPVSGSVVPMSQRAVTFEWRHNTIDGSLQTAAELQYSVDEGATWATVKATSQQSATIANTFGMNERVLFRARTKGVHVDWSPWSGNMPFNVYQHPTVAFDAPGSGFVVRNVPLDVSIGYTDGSGSLTSLLFTIADSATGEVMFTREGAELAITVGKDEFLPEDGGRYTLAVTARSTSSLQSSATRDVSVSFAPPKRTSLRIETDQDRGYVNLRCVVNNSDDGEDVESISVWRDSEDGSVLLASDLVDGSEITDMYAPLNVDYAYRAVTLAASGAVRSVKHAGAISTPYTFFYWGNGCIARAMYDPEETIAIERPNKVLRNYAGRAYPVRYDNGNLSEARKFSAAVFDDDEAAMFRHLVIDGGQCVYKSVMGAVFRADVSANLSPDVTAPNRYGSVSVDITRIDGDAL